MFKKLDPSRTWSATSGRNRGDLQLQSQPDQNVSSRYCDRSIATERATILLGCYRTGAANDPEIYVRAIVSVLMRYPEQVVNAVTEPATGLPSRLKWLPAVAELVEACEAEMAPIYRAERAAREAAANRRSGTAEGTDRPTKEQLEGAVGRPLVDWRSYLSPSQAAQLRADGVLQTPNPEPPDAS